MEREIRVFRSFDESERADRDYYQSLSPAQRMDILLDLINQWQGDKASKGFERVYRVTKLHED
jgi:hypothetical protein